MRASTRGRRPRDAGLGLAGAAVVAGLAAVPPTPAAPNRISPAVAAELAAGADPQAIGVPQASKDPSAWLDGPRARASAVAGGGEDPAGRRTSTPIKHVVVIIGENHTFDNVFATTPRSIANTC